MGSCIPLVDDALVPDLAGGVASGVPAATHAADAIVRAEPFDAIEIDLLHLWGEERPPQAG